MDRYDITIQMLGVEASGPQYVWEKVPAEEGELVLYTDAQATIAALQARVQELETELGCPTWVCDCCGRVSSMGWINIVNETMDGIDYDMECPNCHTRQIEEDSAADLVRERDEFESQLTQRTAELEAAKAELNTVRRDAGLDCGDHSCLYAMNKTGMRTNGGCRCSPKRMKNDLERSRKAYDDLQAELERVRSLIKALPKVEGEVEVYHHESGLRHSVVARPANKYYSSFDTPEEAGAYAAILKHRQGMEG